MANQQNNNNLNNGIPLPPNSQPNLMNQPQIPHPQVPFQYSPQSINMMSHPSPMPPGVQVNYSGSPITGPVFQPIPQPAQPPVINQVPRPQQQGSPFINIQPQQSPPVTSPINQPKKSGSSKKEKDGVETHVTKLGLGRILYLCNIQANPFNYGLSKFEMQSRFSITDDAKCAIALALKYRMIEAVKQSIMYSQKRRLTLLPSNIYYTDFPIAQFAKLEAERRILSSNKSIKPLNTGNSESLVNSFDFGFQGPPLTKKSSSFFQSAQSQNQDKNDAFSFFNSSSNNQKNENDDPDTNTEIKSNISSTNLPEIASTANILERFRNEVLYGVAARVYGKKREEVTNLISDTEENKPIIDQTPLKKLLPEIKKDQNVVIEDVYQYVERNNVISSRSRSKPVFNLQSRKVIINLKKNVP